MDQIGWENRGREGEFVSSLFSIHQNHFYFLLNHLVICENKILIERCLGCHLQFVEIKSDPCHFTPEICLCDDCAFGMGTISKAGPTEPALISSCCFY